MQDTIWSTSFPGGSPGPAMFAGGPGLVDGPGCDPPKKKRKKKSGKKGGKKKGSKKSGKKKGGKKGSKKKSYKTMAMVN
jgi:hypothetical protein